MEKKKTWFITGTSNGFGLALVKQLLAKGDNVAATTRNIATMQDLVNTSAGQLLLLQVDLLREESIATGVASAVNEFGQIDYLVNNAGYGLLGGIEESSKEEVQANFDVNVFGLLSVTRAILPHMRKAGSGHIINISSVFGLIAGAGWGIYCATKFAVEGLSEALAQEVKLFGINVTIIEPGYFRTNFLNTGSIITPKKPITDYSTINEIKSSHATMVGTQIGDPEKAAAAIINISLLSDPPLRLLLGSDALSYANYKIKMLQEGIAANTQTTLSTDFGT